ncbi:MAG TPA: MBL fold metallo-hydrolase [Polyangiaceae bacterium]
MPITNSQSNTRIDEIADRIYRISTPVPPGPELPPGFSFNQFLIVDDAPLLFHTGPQRLFPLVREAVAAVLPPERIHFVGFSHAEPDENGSLAQWLETAPNARPVCGRIAAMVADGDMGGGRPVHAMGDGETLALGRSSVRWFDAPHVPHGWDCGFVGEITTRTLLCGDLFTQAGAELQPVTESEILGPSEAMRGMMDYFAHGPNTQSTLERLAAFEPRLLACMHGSSFRGDGAAQLRALAAALAG